MEIVLTHANTDFDALAAMLAAAKLHPGAIPVLPRALNRNVKDFLALYRDEMPFRLAEEVAKGPVDQLILVDTQSYSTPRGMHPGTKILILDHHPLDHPAPAHVTYDGEPTGATTTFLVNRLREQHIPLTSHEASLLLLGIYEDTGNLSYSTTTSRDVMVAGWLMERGASLDVVNDFLHRPLSPAQRDVYEALERAAKSLEIQGQTIVVASAQTAEYVEELSSIAHKLNELFDPDASFVLVQQNHHLQMIARSRTEAVDVAAVMRPFGGGGHSKAAAALVRDRPVREVEEELLGVLNAHVRAPATVRTVMSRGVHTLSPAMPLADASVLMQRWGHEGFPVAQDGILLGMLTRREVDRAMQHRLGNTPVRSYMRKGDFAVTPEDSVARVRHLMMDHDLGQIPVIENGRLTGIVTRTDVIRLMAAPRETARPALGERMRASLPADALALLEQASQTASEMGFTLYLVGGLVRDLLLGIPNLDLDLVVEGDAIALAQRLAKEAGGTVRKHTRFGTAKWHAAVPRMAETGSPASGPLVLDFVTARTEFYEHPEALPTVEASSLRQDLYRRDFTINTMALRLDEQHFGQLVDFYGGEKDLEHRLIRVLHNLSFVEDATRMLRAVRLEQRLGFAIEKRTLELMQEALDLLDRVSGERLRHELYLILAEAEPEKTLLRLAELGVIQRLSPALTVDGAMADRFREARRRLPEWRVWGLEPLDAGKPVLPAILLALLAHGLATEQMDALFARLSIVTDNARLLRQASELNAASEEIGSPGIARSRLYGLLLPYPAAALFVLWLTGDGGTRNNVELYLRDLRGTRPRLNGNALRTLGLVPGPVYKWVLGRVLEEQLDGRVANAEDAKLLVLRLLADRGGAEPEAA